ncbi:MAG: NAD(P)-binding protein [Chloroflexaceae bacterium]|nr:NAD(P)-binding protein [Chloroflexaceae bacterium]NJO04212.1 NAD(P)-binding protein [Chloroflexaceae bacterium]
MRVVIAGAGPAGMVAAKLLADRGHEVLVFEKRHVPGGKVSAWKDADGDWVESGLHVFFGAYRNLLNFLHTNGLHDTFDWRPPQMIFASPEHGLAPINFVRGLPAPFNGLAGVATSKLLPWPDKLRMAIGLLRPIFGNQAYIDQQDNQTYAAWHLRHGMGERSLRDVMDTMALSLNFARCDNVSAKLPLTAMLHFAKETDASKMALVKGSPHTRIWLPLSAKLKALGGTVEMNRKIVDILYNPVVNMIDGFVLEDGTIVRGDVYISAMPVHSLRKVLPDALREMPYFGNLRHLKGRPVITVQFFFDRQVTGVNHLLFSSNTDISVYADMANVAPDYSTGGPSIVQFVVAPADTLINQDDETIVEHVMNDFIRLHPIAAEARLRKYTIVRIPNSVYQAVPGVDAYRPDQASPVPNLFLAGDYTQQEFLASIEGAVRSARRCVERVDAYVRLRQSNGHAAQQAASPVLI